MIMSRIVDPSKNSSTTEDLASPQSEQFEQIMKLRGKEAPTKCLFLTHETKATLMETDNPIYARAIEDAEMSIHPFKMVAMRATIGIIIKFIGDNPILEGWSCINNRITEFSIGRASAEHQVFCINKDVFWVGNIFTNSLEQNKLFLKQLQLFLELKDILRKFHGCNVDIVAHSSPSTGYFHLHVLMKLTKAHTEGYGDEPPYKLKSIEIEPIIRALIKVIAEHSDASPYQ